MEKVNSKSSKKTIKVLTFGTFDIFHKGHEHFLTQSKKYGTHLYVIIARDQTVKKVKGHMPLNNELKRLKKISSLHYVHKALLGNKGDKHRIIEKIMPDIICLGYDQVSFTTNLRINLGLMNLDPKIIKFKSGYKPHKYKSSKMRLRNEN